MIVDTDKNVVKTEYDDLEDLPEEVVTFLDDLCITITKIFMKINNTLNQINIITSEISFTQ